MSQPDRKDIPDELTIVNGFGRKHRIDWPPPVGSSVVLSSRPDGVIEIRKIFNEDLKTAIKLRKGRERIRGADSRTPSIDLSSREVEIMKMAAQGIKSKDIADRLRLSYATVHSHSTRIYEKLGATSRIEAIQIMRQRNILQEKAPEQKRQTNPNIKPTSRELEIISLCTTGMTADEIATHLDLSPNTVRTTQRNLYRKLDVHNKEEALDVVMDMGLIPHPAEPNIE